MHLGWVDFELDIPPSCPVVQPVLPNSHQPQQNEADGGTLKFQVNPTQLHDQMGHPVFTFAFLTFCFLTLLGPGEFGFVGGSGGNAVSEGG